MAKTNRKYSSQTYPEEKEGRTKNANKKLRGQIKSLKKQLAKLEEDNRTLRRSFNKSCQYIDEKIQGKSIEEVLEDIRTFDYKETERGRQREIEKREKTVNRIDENCPDCGKTNKEGFVKLSFLKYELLSCKCGYRTRKDKGEGIERS